ncbi:MAG: bifunctional riboflavin kinase/FAD synthetase [Pseudomonadota bacterium]
MVTQRGRPLSSRDRPVVTIGNFDGLHHGHRAVIDQARHKADQVGAPLAALLFDPHPRAFFSPQQAPFLLTDIEHRCTLLRDAGVDSVLIAPFNKDFARVPAETFVNDFLAQRLGTQAVVVGADFRFGHRAAGDGAALQEWGRAKGIDVELVAKAREDMGKEDDGGEVFASRRIRAALREGRPGQAARALGRVWTIRARVVRGEQRGRTLGYPTANLPWPKDIVMPAFGVYAVQVTLPDGTLREGVASFGVRPMFPAPPAAEVYLFDFTGNLYDQMLIVHWHTYLREEQRFEDIDALKSQMAQDVHAARAALETPFAREDG